MVCPRVLASVTARSIVLNAAAPDEGFSKKLASSAMGEEDDLVVVTLSKRFVDGALEHVSNGVWILIGETLQAADVVQRGEDVGPRVRGFRDVQQPLTGRQPAEAVNRHHQGGRVRTGGHFHVVGCCANQQRANETRGDDRNATGEEDRNREPTPGHVYLRETLLTRHRAIDVLRKRPASRRYGVTPGEIRRNLVAKRHLLRLNTVGRLLDREPHVEHDPPRAKLLEWVKRREADAAEQPRRRDGHGARDNQQDAL